MSYRVAHAGTGLTGREALRGIINDPQLALVGLLVSSSDKAGMDAGTLCALPDTGLTATTDIQTILDSAPDCFCYCPTFVRLVYPQSLPPELLTRLQGACRTGGAGFFGTGISPGFTVDALPLYCATLSSKPRRIRVAERILQGTYEDPLSFAALGFGAVPAHNLTEGVQQ